MKTALGLCLCLAALTCSAQLSPTNRPPTVTLAWDPSPSTNVTGYNIYYGPNSRAYTNKVDVSNVTNATLTLRYGTLYYFAATAYDGSGLESDFSNEVSYQFPYVPGAPQMFRLSIGPVGLAGSAKISMVRGPFPWEVSIPVLDIPKRQPLRSPKDAANQ